MTLVDQLEQYSYAYLMSEALQRVPDTVDKREGSIIYDALAPACYVLAEYYMNLRDMVINTFISTAEGEWLDLKVEELGLYRKQATVAEKRADFASEDGPMEVPIGSRWSTISTTEPLIYRVKAEIKANGVAVPGAYVLEAEEAGTKGHLYTGNLIPVDFIQGVASAEMTTTILPGEDVETDAALRSRYFDALGTSSFGGNFADYKEKVRSIPGVGEVQIYPIWNGGGTVKVSIIDSTFRACSDVFVKSVQEAIDPPPQSSGLGIAPIGHTVTVVTATEVVLPVELSLSLQQGYSVEGLRGEIETAISDYFLSCRQTWGNEDAQGHYLLAIYTSRIVAALVSIPGIINVRGISIAGSPSDYILQEDATTQELPILGEVTINV